MANDVKTPRHNNSFFGREKKRCSVKGCKKRAKDFIKGKPFCRIHSPMREGFKNENPKARNKRSRN